MEIFINVFLVITNVITILICWAVYGKTDQYKDGMFLGVHIPATKIYREDVQRICEKSRKFQKWYHGGNLVISTAIALIGYWKFELWMIVWVVWITLYIAGIYVGNIRLHKEMYRLKVEHQWFDEWTKKVYIENGQAYYRDDDEYWKKGWYDNPQDPKILVQDRFCTTNTTLNMGRPISKVMIVGTLGITAGVLIWVIVLMVQFMNMEVVLEQKGDAFTFQAAGYEATFSESEIEFVEILAELPAEGFSKTNGGATDEYKVGKFKGKESGKCMMFLYTEYQPILKIELDDQVIFANSKKAGEVEKWYRAIVGRDSSF